MIGMGVLRILVDTNVLVAAMTRKDSENRAVLRACLGGICGPSLVRPCFWRGETLFLEYEDVMGRETVFRKCPLTARERGQLFDSFLSCCEWVQTWFLWRPNLRDEGDNHLVELALAAGAAIVTHNVRDFRNPDLCFPELQIITPRELIRELV